MADHRELYPDERTAVMFKATVDAFRNLAELAALKAEYRRLVREELAHKSRAGLEAMSSSSSLRGPENR